MLVYRRLWQSSCVIANNARKSYLSKAIKHLPLDVTNYITCESGLCDVISRSRNRPSSPSVKIHTLLKEYRRTRKGMKDKKIRHGAVVNRLWNNIFVNPPSLPLLCEISGVLHLAQPGLTAGRQAGWQAGRLTKYW